MNYYIQGNIEKADQIKAAFKAKGCVMHTGIQCDLNDMIYYSLNGKVVSIKLRNLDLFKTHPDYKELELPKPHYDIANFHAGMPVLVRADNNCRWDYSVFSRITGNKDWPFAVCNGVSFTQCIPYNDDTKHLLGTTNMCEEKYINW